MIGPVRPSRSPDSAVPEARIDIPTSSHIASMIGATCG